MQQLDILAGIPPLPPREIGEACAKQCLENAEDLVSFDTEGCRKFVHGWLIRHGKQSGETLVNVAKAHGYVPHEDRAFGSIFSTLARRGLIRCVGFCERAKGHGTAGGRIWDVAR